VVEVVPFAQALHIADTAKKRHVILGNGFSIALKPDIFTYHSLYENADFSAAPHMPALFDALKTRDFETVIRSIQSAARILAAYGPGHASLISQLEGDAAFLKTALVSAVAKRHPDRPYDIEPEQYAACRKFLANFDHIYTLNYDVLLYWALMQSEVDDLKLLPDDGFRHPEDAPDQPYVSWQQAHSPTVSYLHGALHLFDNGTEIIKYTWSKTDVPIVDQIRQDLDIDNFPLFVSEGESAQKWQRILHNAYLHKAIRSLESCCAPSTAAIFVFGHSLADNDRHVLRQIVRGGAANLLVSVFGEPQASANKEVIANAGALVAMREKHRPDRPLRVTFYDAASAHVWG
jgi:hypothetical protein